MKTTLHYYHFNVREPKQAQAWADLKRRLKKTHRLFHALGKNPGQSGGEEQVVLNPEHLFSNQWIEAGEGGRRLFDWYMQYLPDLPDIKRGYYLDITDEMRQTREETYKCGYCGNQYVKPEQTFCDKCLGSEYLEEKELHLLRLVPVAGDHTGDNVRPGLTDEERQALVPLYREAQGLGKISREQEKKAILRQKVAALVSEAEKKAKALVEEAITEQEAYTWLLDHGYRDIDNIIYYDHSKTFSFGWLRSIPEDQKQELVELLKDFPFPWEWAKRR